MSETISKPLFYFPDGRMSRKDAAAYLGCSPKTLADWALKATGPAYVRVGGKVFYFKAELDRFIAGGARNGRATP